MPRLDDMKLFAQVAESGSITGAAIALGMPKQSVSRRLAELEKSLGVELARRTTRQLALTDVGRAYAARCSEVTRLAQEANRAASSQLGLVNGTLRVTADHTFGEAFLPDLVTCYLRDNPEVHIDVLLTARVVGLVEEGFDVAFRVGAPPEVAHLAATRLGPARLCTVASPAYLASRDAPTHIDDLADHDCLAAVPALSRTEWPFVVEGALRMVPVRARVRVNGLHLTRHAALAGAGIAHLPEFAIAEDIARGDLVALLESFAPDVGGVHVVYPHTQLLAPKVREFVALAVTQFAASPLP